MERTERSDAHEFRRTKYFARSKNKACSGLDVGDNPLKKTRICTECGFIIKFPDRRRGGRNVALHYHKHHRQVVTPGMVRFAEIVWEILQTLPEDVSHPDALAFHGKEKS